MMCRALRLSQHGEKSLHWFSRPFLVVEDLGRLKFRLVTISEFGGNRRKRIFSTHASQTELYGSRGTCPNVSRVPRRRKGR